LNTEEPIYEIVIYLRCDGFCFRKKGEFSEEFPTYISSTGTKMWYNRDGQLHRTTGPAVIYYDGQKEWWVNGYCKITKQMSESAFSSLIL